MKKKIYLYAILFIEFLLIPSTSWSKNFDFYLGVGNLSQFSNKIQIDDQGKTSFLSFKPTFHAGIDYEIFSNISLIPELILTLPEKGRDPNISKWQYFALMSGGYKLSNWMFRFGFGFAMQRLSADGGTESLNNGTSTTSFPLPETSSVSQNFVTLLGVQYEFLQNWSARVEAMVYNAEDGEDRAVSHTLTVIYHFGDLFQFEGDHRKTQKKRRYKKRKKRLIKKKRSS